MAISDLSPEPSWSGPGTSAAGAPRPSTTLCQQPPDSGAVVRNVLSNWGAHAVALAAGFILPRFISDHLGKEVLGLWDFAWSLVAYTDFLALGTSAAVERHVAQHCSLGDWLALSRTASTALVLLLGSFVVGLGLSAGLACLAPYLISISNREVVSEARTVVLVLGAAAALRLPMLAFTGTINGCNRYDVSGLVSASCHLVQTVAMLMLVLTSHGLVSLAFAALFAQILSVVLGWLAARLVCPKLRLSPRLVSLLEAPSLCKYGIKVLLYTSLRIATYQTNAILIAHFLGPAFLAVFSRYRALLLHIENIAIQYARVLLPAVSARHARSDTDGVRHLLVQSSIYNLFIVLPMAAVLGILGDPILRVWMGDSYAAPMLGLLLALGHVVPFSQRASLNVLLGLGQHGAAALGMAVAAIGAVLLGAWLIGPAAWGLTGAAIALGIPLSMATGLTILFWACRKTGITVADYLRLVLPRPVLTVTPFAAWLLLARYGFGTGAGSTLAVGLGGGAFILGLLYWRYALPVQVRERIWAAVHR